MHPSIETDEWQRQEAVAWAVGVFQETDYSRVNIPRDRQTGDPFVEGERFEPRLHAGVNGTQYVVTRIEWITRARNDVGVAGQ